jgi:hypothetical protein
MRSIDISSWYGGEDGVHFVASRAHGKNIFIIILLNQQWNLICIYKYYETR